MSTSLMKHTERAERKRTLLDELCALLPEARAEYDGLRERALDSLERDFGIARDRVSESGDLEVTPEEFAHLRTTAASLANFEEPNPITDFQIRVFVVQS